MKKIIIGVFVVCCFVGMVAFNVHKQTQTGGPEILFISVQSGPFAHYAKHGNNGINLWLERHPEWKDKVKVVDSQGLPSVAVNIYMQELAMYKPKIIIASITPVISAIQPMAEKDGIFIIVSSLHTKANIKKGSNLQRMYFNPADSLGPIVKVFEKSNKLALIHVVSEYGISEKKTIEEMLAKSNKKLAVVETFEPNEMNPREVVLKVLKEKPDAIMVIGSGLGYRNIFKSLEEYEFKGKVLTNVAFVDPVFFDDFKKYKNPIYFTASSLETEDQTEFKKMYQERFGAKACVSAASPYDSLTLATIMIEKGITTQEEIYKLGKMQGLIDEITFLPDGEVHYPSVLLKIGNGKLEQVNPDNE